VATPHQPKKESCRYLSLLIEITKGSGLSHMWGLFIIELEESTHSAISNGLLGDKS